MFQQVLATRGGYILTLSQGMKSVIFIDIFFHLKIPSEGFSKN